jgi:hypothetical protein
MSPYDSLNDKVKITEPSSFQVSSPLIMREREYSFDAVDDVKDAPKVSLYQKFI